MVQVFLIDEDGFYTGEDAWVEEPQKNEITEPYSVGYIRGKWDFEVKQWVEGATKEEILEWEEQDKIDICTSKTVEERLAESEQKLEEKDRENKILKAQIEANASSYEFLESCVMEMAGKVYA